ncbi:MAG: hypothetical protein K2Q06_06925, partial [Parvularculaceae bacterium]|nr:hypothetical protein [Parvularculaceae bacterium]
MSAGFAAWRLDRASWRAFGAWFAIAFAYNLWAINMPSPYTRALAAAGGRLPESQPGFPAGEPLRSLEALGTATEDYLLWQWLDIPYAFLAVMTTSTAIALGLRALPRRGAAFRAILWLPLIYFGCEIAENTLVEMFAAKILHPGPIAVSIQQAATTLKFLTGYGALACAAAGIAVAAAA